MALLDELLPDLAVRISQVPAFIGRNMLRKAVQQFCHESLMWQLALDVELSAERRYPLALPQSTILVGIVAAAVDGKPLRQGFDFELGHDQALVMLSRHSRGVVSLVLALKPDRTSEFVPDELLDHYSMAITAGAAAMLGANEKQVWALSKQQVRYYQDEFERGYADGRKFALNKASRLYESPTRHEFY